MFNSQNHVGRPTNEEVASRKRIKAFKIILPLVIVGVFACVFVGGNMTGMMGNSFDYDKCRCEEGWEVRDGNMCYKDTEEQEQVEPILIGDINNDGAVTLEDYVFIKNKIEGEEELTDEEKIVYDLNQDGVVDVNDVDGYSTGTNGQFVFENQYTCPLTKVEEAKENGVTTTKVYQYSYNAQENKCDVTISISESKKAVCDLSTVRSNNTESEDDLEIWEDEDCDNDVCHDSVDEVPNKNSADIVNDDDISYIDRDSNLMDYSSNSQNRAIVHLYTKNSQIKVKEGPVLAYSDIPIVYNLYSGRNCQKRIKSFSINIKGESSNINVNNNMVGITLNTRHFTLGFSKKIIGKTYSVRQVTSPRGYESNNECKNFVVKNNMKVFFNNKPVFNNKYVYVTVNGKEVSNQNRIKIYSSDKSIIYNSATKLNKRFGGFRIQRSQDNKYLCYNGRNSSKTSWKPNCKYYVLIQSGGSINKVIGGLKSGSTLKLKSYWVKQ